LREIIFSLLAFLFTFTLCFGQEKKSPDPKEVETLVNRAAALVESKGQAAFDELRKKDGEWFHGNTYVFVDDMTGVSLVLPPNPSEEGQSFVDMKDADGKPVVQEFINTAKEKGSGWVEYMWPKPGQTTPSKKRSFVKRTKMPDGKLVIVGSGIYLE